MWTTIILLCFLQLQIILINPCSALSSTDDSFVDVELRDITYSEILGPGIKLYNDSCNIIRLHKNKVHYFQVGAYCVQKRYRMLNKAVSKELAMMKHILENTSAKIAWIFSSNPVNENACYYAILNSEGFSVKTTPCTSTSILSHAITVQDIKSEKRCQNPIQP
ncbi:unnamed protein product [Orchesella dallaii]|uniref:Uncharacterized protein n=1 Tax=Orchesella dallaii TaxID=48710 RepID=A0ABP1QCT2_9HEXA